jgi:hypothetical protein
LYMAYKAPVMVTAPPKNITNWENNDTVSPFKVYTVDSLLARMTTIA